MSKKTKTLCALVLLVPLLAVFFTQCGPKKKPAPTPTPPPTSDSCNCEADWFPHSQTPPPAEGIGSPFDTSSTTNCIFHQWSWQKFLWLTKPSPSGALFLDTLVQVDAKMQPVTAGVSSNPAIHLVLEDTAQAGSGGTLHTNPAYGDGNSYMIYYAIFTDQTMLDSAAVFKSRMLANPSLKNNYWTWPIGSLELKVSWVNANAIPTAQQGSYFITNALIKTGTTYTETRVAMLGMHVVGRVINHPEFIWATFEHQNMAPYYNWATTTDSTDSPISSSSDLLLYKQGVTTTMAGITWNGSAPDSLYRVFTLFKYGVPRTAQDSFMSNTSQSEPLNYNNIDGLNQCVAANLTSENDLWANYFYNGSIWVNTDGLTTGQQDTLIDTLGSNIGNVTYGSSARGSLSVFNITMETYVQQFGAPVNAIHTIGTGNIANCFSCHNSEASLKTENTYSSPLYLSHIFRDYLTSTNTTTLKEAKQNGIIDYIRVQRLKLQLLKQQKQR